MTELATLLADLESLKEARRSGVLKVRFDEREVTFRSDAEIAAQIAAIETEISGSGPRNVMVRSTKGWS
jgi:hypothetical protein